MKASMSIILSLLSLALMLVLAQSRPSSDSLIGDQSEEVDTQRSVRQKRQFYAYGVPALAAYHQVTYPSYLRVYHPGYVPL
ncbi:unnamed protein product [Cylicocyclus nassatus]|uniref:Uncharacterized protein n=1 Tax=Cylicocyclus nassatus TaxID=53992 RepID=A0AA36MBC1_CYLNA|nr:unnamed protein product [Cylicocyclus nassatus]